MKKFTIAILAILMLLILAGCDTSSDMAPIEKARGRAVEIGEQYLNFEITGKEAKELLEDIKVPETKTGYSSDSLRSRIKYLCFIIVRPETTYEQVEEKVRDIAEMDLEALEKAGEYLEAAK